MKMFLKNTRFNGLQFLGLKRSTRLGSYLHDQHPLGARTESTISVEKSIVGAFCLIIFNYKHRPVSCFIFLNIEESIIEYYTLYEGKSLRKEFIGFITNVLKEKFKSYSSSTHKKEKN